MGMSRPIPRSRELPDSLAHVPTTLAGPAKMQSMAKPLTADDILPLVVALPAEERARLLRLIVSQQGSDASMYRSLPASREEFSTDDEALAWDGGGWEDLS